MNPKVMRLRLPERRLLAAAMIGALALALVAWFSAMDYLTFLSPPSPEAEVPPQIAGAIAAIPDAPAGPHEQGEQTKRPAEGEPAEQPVIVLPPETKFPVISPKPPPPIVPQATTSAASFVYTFSSSKGALHEAVSMDKSSSPYFWLSAGGSMVLDTGVGRTLAGEAPLLSRWRLAYKWWNPRDTEGGQYPQNVFRLVSRKRFADARVSVIMRIDADNLTATPYRNASNGLLIMTRYQDKNTLYYAGLRVDGTAVIKKKYKGTYYTMAQKSVFPGRYATSTPNLLPHDEWLTIAAATRADERGGVTVDLYLTRASEKEPRLILSARDDGKKYGNTPAIVGDGNAGIRTDFMDVSFKTFYVDPL